MIALKNWHKHKAGSKKVFTGLSSKSQLAKDHFLLGWWRDHFWPVLMHKPVVLQILFILPSYMIEPLNQKFGIWVKTLGETFQLAQKGGRLLGNMSRRRRAIPFCKERQQSRLCLIAN